MGGHIFLLKSRTFPRMSLIKPLAPCLHNPIKKYSQAIQGYHHLQGMEKRAPSIAEEFERMAEQKLKEAKQGVASQVSDKAYDGAEEATLGEANLEKVKKRCMEHEPGADYRRRGDHDHDDQ